MGGACTIAWKSFTRSAKLKDCWLPDATRRMQNPAYRGEGHLLAGETRVGELVREVCGAVLL